MDSSAVSSTLVSMQAAGSAQQFSLLALKNANEMEQVAANLLIQAAEAGKALLADGVGGTVDKAA
jgi:hypothetical protein